MTEDFVSVRVHAGDGVAFDGHLGHAAQEIAIELHAIGIVGVLGDGFFAIEGAHAHIQQHGDGVLGVLFSHQRGDDAEPGIMILFLGKFREKFHIGAGNLGEEVRVCGFGGAGGAEDEQGDRAEDQRKKLFHGK